MLLYAFFFLALIFLGFDLHKTVQNAITIKYTQVKTLVNVVRQNQKSIMKVIWMCCYLIGKTLYTRVWQYLNRSVKCVGKNKYEISYVVNGILYKIVVQSKRGPKTILQVINDKDEDITEVFQQYFGPNEDFHGQNYTPLFFNSENLHILRTTGEEVNFDTNRIIKL